GINKGGNMGQDITYSGTVMAALEATMIGVPSMAVSVDARADFDFSAAAQVAKRAARYIVDVGLPASTLLNINTPNVSPDELKGVLFTGQGQRLYGDEIAVNKDPRGKRYYWIAGQELGFVEEEGTDIMAVRAGYASVTPIHFRLTNREMLAKLQKESWEI
ncbi:MAG: 5'/3'-nucleotidase SurE, partial [Alphaproteobacteria bacterium]